MFKFSKPCYLVHYGEFFFVADENFEEAIRLLEINTVPVFHCHQLYSAWNKNNS